MEEAPPEKRPRRACTVHPPSEKEVRLFAREGPPVDVREQLEDTINGLRPPELEMLLRDMNALSEVRSSTVAAGSAGTGEHRGLFAVETVPVGTSVALLADATFARIKNPQGKKHAAWSMPITRKLLDKLGLEDCIPYAGRLPAPDRAEWDARYKGNYCNDDRRRANAEYVTVVRYNASRDARDWSLYVFVVAKREIPAGTEILVDYGSGKQVDGSWAHRSDVRPDVRPDVKPDV